MKGTETLTFSSLSYYGLSYLYSTLDTIGLDKDKRWASTKKIQQNVNLFHSEGLWETDVGIH